MSTVLLKILALSGVISAGCFAVWKANTELQPAQTSSPSQFTALEGEPEEGIGLGGQPLPKATATLPPAKGLDPEPTVEPDNGLALVDYDFAKAAANEEQATPRRMPAAFPPPQDEPSLAETAETFEPEPGVSSLEILEAAEPSPTLAPEGRVRIPAGAAAKSPALVAQPLNRYPKEAGTPILITPTPRSALPKTPAAAPDPRTRNSDQIVPANAEELVDESQEFFPGPRTVPANPATAPDLSTGFDNAGPSLPPRERTRGPGVQSPETQATPEAEASPWDLSADQITVPEVIEQPEPVEAAPATNPFSRRSRTSIPTPVEQAPTPELETEPAPLNLAPNHRPNRTPLNSHAVDEVVTPTPSLRSSIPSANPTVVPTPVRTITPDMLIGDATVEDPLMTQTQQPQLRIEKKAQAEAEVGEKFIYEIVVQNVGSMAAQYVVVEERIPKGTRMERSQPQARMGRDRILRWDLGTIQPNAQQVIQVEVTPLEAGPIGSVATVRFAAQVATKTVVTAPTLSLSIKHPTEVAVGEVVPLKFIVTNTGTGTARKATLRAILQEGLTHQAGLDLDQEIGTLAPGQSKEIDLSVTATEQGRYSPAIVVSANGIEQENRTLDLSVIESRLTLSREGHVRRFVNRPAEFSTKVTNHSVETMRNVIITEHLPEGVTPVGEMGKFRWSAQDRTVTWKVSELGPGQYSDLKLTVVSARAGALTGKVEALAASGHRAELPTELDVQGFSSLTLDFQGDGKAVAVGDQVSMRVTVGNRGSAPAKQVQALFELPPQMTFVTAKGSDNIQATQEGNLVTFAVLDELAPNSNQTYDIVLTAAEEGRPLVAVELHSADLPKSVRQEEAVTITP